MKTCLCGAALLTLALATTSCSRSGTDAPPAASTATAPPAAPKVTQSTFEPLYRISKSVQGATAAGVNYAKFGELMQQFSSELGIAKDHTLNEADKQLLALYEAAYQHYQVSGTLWHMKIQAGDVELWKGEIPIWFKKNPDDALLKVAAAYDLPVADRKAPYTGGVFKTIPGDSIQRVWQRADKSLNEATELYYGRAPGATPTR